MFLLFRHVIQDATDQITDNPIICSRRLESPFARSLTIIYNASNRLLFNSLSPTLHAKPDDVRHSLACSPTIIRIGHASLLPLSHMVQDATGWILLSQIRNAAGRISYWPLACEISLQLYQKRFSLDLFWPEQCLWTNICYFFTIIPTVANIINLD